MVDNFRISGIHHITAISSGAAENLSFYENVLGLRLVKQTVNFDDPRTWHLYYGDDAGSPGTILTFFPREQLPKGRPGAGMVTAIGFAIPRHSFYYWYKRLQEKGLSPEGEVRFNDPVIRFTDPHGLPLELIGAAEDRPRHIRSGSPVPQENAIAGFHSATALLHHLEDAHTLLTAGMGMTPAGRAENRFRFRMADEQSPGHYYDILLDVNAEQGIPGGGTVHHIAFRTEDEETQKLWQGRLREKAMAVTEVRDRKYFRSVYFDSPGGILFEIATDGPGFAVDEPAEALGETLQLPVQYELMRADIENRLPPLRSGGEMERLLPKAG